jgi:rubrerythrin
MKHTKETLEKIMDNENLKYYSESDYACPNCGSTEHTMDGWDHVCTICGTHYETPDI